MGSTKWTYHKEWTFVTDCFIFFEKNLSINSWFNVPIPQIYIFILFVRASLWVSLILYIIISWNLLSRKYSKITTDIKFVDINYLLDLKFSKNQWSKTFCHNTCSLSTLFDDLEELTQSTKIFTEISKPHGTIIRTGIACKKIPCYMRDTACSWLISKLC